MRPIDSSLSLPVIIVFRVYRGSLLIERKRFYEISRSSLVEVDNHIEAAKELGFLSNESLNELDEKLNELFAKLSNFIEKPIRIKSFDV